jgi:hypothetical protein
MKPVYRLLDTVTNEEVEQSYAVDALVEQVLYIWSIRAPNRIVSPRSVPLPENKGSMDAHFVLELIEPWDGSQA